MYSTVSKVQSNIRLIDPEFRVAVSLEALVFGANPKLDASCSDHDMYLGTYLDMLPSRHHHQTLSTVLAVP